MIDFRDSILISLLKCGTSDISILDGVEYNWEGIIQTCIQNYGDIEINNLMRCVFEVGLCEIDNAVRARMVYLSARKKLGLATQKELNELNDILPLNVFGDFDSWHNFLDTSIWIENYPERYNTYFRKELDRFADMTGYEINVD